MSVKIVHNAMLSSAQANTALSTEFGAEIKKGSPKVLNITSVGKTLRIVFVASSDEEEESGRVNIVGVYGFLIIIAFYEPNEETAEERKADYDKMIRDWIDNDLGFGGTCRGTTQLGKMQYAESPDSEGLFYGVMPLVCEREETAGNR